MAEPASERPSGLPDWSEAADSNLGTSAFSDMAGSLATDSDGLGPDSEAILPAERPSGLPGGSAALGPATGIWASSCLVNSDLVGNGILGVLGMGMGCEQSAKGPSGPPGDAVAVASLPGNWVSLAEFRGSTLI